MVAIAVAVGFGVYLTLIFPKLSTGVLSHETSTTNDTLGLSLTLKLNSTSIHPGQRLAIYITLFNNLPTNVNLTMASHWKVRGFPVAIVHPCYVYPLLGNGEPVEFIIVKGNHSLAELEATSVNRTVVTGGCYHGGFYYPLHLIFYARSSVGNLTGHLGANPDHYSVNVSMVSNFTVNGYWAYPINASEAKDVMSSSYTCVANSNVTCPYFGYPEVAPIAEQTFTKGVYTLVVSDEWGQTVILHFVVSP